MAVSTYAELLASIAGWLNRDDLTSRIPDFVTLAEAKLNARVMHRNMQTLATISITGETYTLPDAFAGVVSLRINTSGYERIEYRSEEQFDQLPVSTSGTPRYYTIAGGSLVFWPVPGDAVAARFRYRTRLTALSDANPSNWLLTSYPHAYLYGALMEAAPYLMNDDRVNVWGPLFAEAISDIKLDGARQSEGAYMQTVSGIAD